MSRPGSRDRPPRAGSPPALSRTVGRLTKWGETHLGRNRETVLRGLGVGGLLLAALVTFAPWLFPGGLLRALGESLLANRGAVVLLAVVAVLSAGVTVARSGGRRAEEDDPGRTDEWFDRVTPSETTLDRTVAGRDIDVTLAAENDDRDDIVAWRRRYNRREARRRLRTAVVETLVDDREVTRSEAERLVNVGAWTDSRRAGSFLSGTPTRGDDGEEPPRLPLRTRVRDWLLGESFDRNVEATVAELLALRDVEDGRRPTTPGERPTANTAVTEKER